MVLAQHDLQPVTPYVGYTAVGEPTLLGSRCSACAAQFLGPRNICGSCGARDVVMPVTFSNTGKLYNYTMVYRSNPGVATPFISAIVDLDGGGVVKGTLIAQPEALRFDMLVEVVFDSLPLQHATGDTSSDNAYLSYHFVPA